MISDAERLGRQRRAVRLLASLLDRAEREHLPAMHWTVHHAGAGLVAVAFALDPQERRAAFQAWCHALGIGIGDRLASRVGGVTLLAGDAERYDGLVNVSVLAIVDQQATTDAVVTAVAAAVFAEADAEPGDAQADAEAGCGW